MIVPGSPTADDACESQSSATCCSPTTKPRRAIGAAQAAKIDASLCSPKLPFVAQDGRTIYLVSEESVGWVLAELEFNASTCEFTILRRSEYRWPREALGRLLSRVVTSSPDGIGEAARMSDAFAEWHAAQFVA